MFERALFVFACIALAALPQAAFAEKPRIRWTFELVAAPAIDSPQVSLLAQQKRAAGVEGDADFTYADPTDGRSYRLVFKGARILPSGMVQFDLDWLEQGNDVLRQRLERIAVDGWFWLALYRQDAGSTVFLRGHPALQP